MAVAMAELLVDCPTGLAGDMLLAACLDLGVPEAVIHEPLRQLGFGHAYSLKVEEASSGGLRGVRLVVKGTEAQPPHRHWCELRERINGSSLAAPLRQRVLAVFEALADAEAAVHGTNSEAVHFHEVGAIDSLVDVVGVCAALLHLAPERLLCKPPPAGRGSVATAHGRLPVPVPAVLELARCHHLPLRGGEECPEGELTTPTGLALMAVLADAFQEPRALTVEAVGVGLGQRRLDRPNLLRLIRCSTQSAAAPEAHWQDLIQQEAWLDDQTPEDLAVLAERLRQAGALEVTTTPVQMQKGRQGMAVTALVHPTQAPLLRRLWLSASPTLGLRERPQGRWVLARRSGHCPSPWGAVRVKQVRRPGGDCTIKVEHDELRRLSLQSGQTLDAVRQVVLSAADCFEPEEDWQW